MPPTLENTQRLFRAGRYVEILREFGPHDKDVSSFQPEHRVLIAHTLLQTGDIKRAVQLVEDEIAQNLPAPLRSRCEIIRCLSFRHNAEISKALHHCQLAVQYAKQGDDHAQFAWALVQRFRLLAELRPSDQLGPMLGDVRRFVTKAGDPHAVAYMHYAVALMEASNGRIQEARRHLDVSRSLIRSYPNAWLEQLNLIAAFFLDFVECDYRRAIANLEEARVLLAVTGSRERTLIECNQGHALLVTGRFRAATERFRSVVHADAGLARLGAMEGLARVYLADGNLVECEETLDAHDALLAQDQHLTAAFAGRWTAATRIRLLLVKKQFTRAAETAELLVKQATDLNDRLLTTELTCLRAEALIALSKADESARSLFGLELPDAPGSIGQLSAYFKARGYLTGTIDSGLSRDMFLRARRIWEEQGNQCALTEFKHLPGDDDGRRRGRMLGASQALSMTSTLAGAMMLAHNPRLLAKELSAAIAVLGCSPDVRLDESGARESRDSERHCVLPLGSQKDTRLSLVCEIPSDPLKTLALSDILRIGAAAVTLQRHTEEERNRAALWPVSAIEKHSGALFATEEMQALLATSRRVAATNIPVLITGETGTGKEILARTIHGYSNQAKAPFLPFNCTSTPKDMLDSQLFGHRRGSFTGATENFQGVIRAAAGGTLFLDEIGDMGFDVQPKLLRFLESGEVHPVGDTHPVRVDVRVIAATNANLDVLVAEGRFREDLFYRLNIVRLHLPPLRERRMEIPALAQHYLEKYAQEYVKGDLRLAEETMEYLVLYRWPGNIRQLANEIRRMAALCESGAVLMPEHLSPGIAASRRTVPASERVLDPIEVVVRLDQPLAAATEHLQRAILQYALKQCGGRLEETAALLGLSRKGLYLKRQRFGIGPPDTSAAVEVA